MGLAQSRTAVLSLTGALLLLTVVVGGRARPDVFQFALISVGVSILVPLVVFALSSGAKLGSIILLALGGAVALPLLQLLPLPQFLSNSSSAAGVAATSYALIGEAAAWRPISLEPVSTLAAFFFVMAPIGIFLGVSALGSRERHVLTGILIAAGIASALIGLLQIAQGPSSALHWYADGPGGSEATGFFSNRNHFASLLYVMILLSSAVLIFSVGTVISESRARVDRWGILAIAAMTMIILLLLGALVMSRSRAGLALTIVALIGIFGLSLSDRRAIGGANLMAKVLGGIVALAILFSSQFALYRMLQRFEADPLEDARLSFAGTAWNAILGALPFGSGMETFVPVFQAFERPQTALLGLYANRAHNDYLEFALEGGVVAILLMAAFLVWFITRSVAAWRKPSGSELDTLFARAASIAIALLLVHALVDYGLRTPAMMSVFAFCCALLIPAPQIVTQGTREKSSEPVRMPRPAQKKNTDRPAGPAIDPAVIRAAINRPAASQAGPAFSIETPIEKATPVTKPDTPKPANPRGRWGEDVDWPAEWKQPNPSGPSSPKETAPEADPQIFDWSKFGPKSPTDN